MLVKQKVVNFCFSELHQILLLSQYLMIVENMQMLADEGSISLNAPSAAARPFYLALASQRL